MTPGDSAGPRLPRVLMGFAVAGAWLVFAVFAVVGDGVQTTATGLAGVIVDYAHTAAWLCLALALTWALVTRSWGRPARSLAVLALALYLAFVLALLGQGAG